MLAKVLLYLIEWLFLYPASGYRFATSGAFDVMGVYGYSWSCAIPSTNVYFLIFDSGTVQPIFSNQRARGLTVRCVQYLPVV